MDLPIAIDECALVFLDLFVNTPTVFVVVTLVVEYLLTTWVWTYKQLPARLISFLSS